MRSATSGRSSWGGNENERYPRMLRFLRKGRTVRSRATRKLRASCWIACILLSLSAACSAPEPGRVVIIGVDGASMKLVQPMMQAGRLPTFASLAKSGAHGVIHSPSPALSPRIWTTVATGKNPAEHGIEGWVYGEPSGLVHLHESTQRRAAALWNIVSSKGGSVSTVNWLMTYPPEVVRGVVVTDHALPSEATRRRQFGNRMAVAGFEKKLDDEGTIDAPPIYPESWAPRIRAIFEHPGSFAYPDPFADGAALPPKMRRDNLSEFFQNDLRAARAAILIDEEIQPELTMILMQGVDRISHMLWGTLQEDLVGDLTRDQQDRAAELMRHYYEIADALVGELISGYGPDDLVIVLADHGFEYIPGRGLFRFGGVHETPASDDGIFFIRGPGIPAGHRIERFDVVDVAPTVLAWMGLPVARDMVGTVASFLDRKFELIDTYDDLPIERVGTSVTASEQEVLRQLEALGYIEGAKAPDEHRSAETSVDTSPAVAP